MQFRNTIIVVILLVLVTGYVYFFEAGKPAEETVKLYQIKPEDISKIDLRYPDQEIELVRQPDNKWLIVKPVNTDADDTTVNNLARAIADCEVKKTVEEKPQSLDAFGLAKPDVVVTVTVKGKGTLPGIEVGKVTPVGFAAYMKTTDKPAVLLTSSAFPPGMKKKIDDLRDRELMTFKVEDAQRVVIEHEGEQPVELERNQDKWQIVKPQKYAADTTQVRQLLSALANAKVDAFVTDRPASVSQYGLEKPRLSITVFSGKESSRQSLLFGNKQSEQGKDGIYVRRGERAPVYTVHGYVLADANKNQTELRDKTVLSFEPSKIQDVKVISGSKNFEIVRAPGKWQIQNGSNGSKTDADVPAVERFLDQIRDLKGLSIVEEGVKDAAKYGLNAPLVQLTLDSKEGKPIGWMKLAKVEHSKSSEATPATPGASQTPDYYALSSASDAVYKISDYNFEQLNVSPEQLRSRNQPIPAPSAKPTAKSP
jgi:hypothetical protein